MGRNKHLTPEQASRAITLINDAKWKPGKVAEHLGVSRTAIRNLVKKFNDPNSVKRDKPSGTRRGIDKAHHQRILEIVEQQQHKNQFELTDILNEEFGLTASRTTYIRLIRELTWNQEAKSKSTNQRHLLKGDFSRRGNMTAESTDFGLDIDSARIYLEQASDANDPLVPADLIYWDAVFTSLERTGENKMTDSELVQAFKTYAEDRCQKFHGEPPTIWWILFMSIFFFCSYGYISYQLMELHTH
jgi:transposase